MAASIQIGANYQLLVRDVRVGLSPAWNGCLLRLTCELDAVGKSAPDLNGTLLALTGEVNAEAGDQRRALAVLDSVHLRLRVDDAVSSSQVQLTGNVPQVSIDAIVRAAAPNGHGPKFTWTIRGMLVADQEYVSAHGQIMRDLTTDEWLSLLESARLRRAYRVSVDLDRVHQRGEWWRESVVHLQQANEHRLQGRPRDAVATLRYLLDQLPEQAVPKNRRQRTKDQRYTALAEELRHVASLAHHPGDDAPPTEWSDEDANSAVVIAAALLSRMGRTAP